MTAITNRLLDVAPLGLMLTISNACLWIVIQKTIMKDSTTTVETTVMLALQAQMTIAVSLEVSAVLQPHLHLLALLVLLAPAFKTTIQIRKGLVPGSSSSS